MIRAELRSNALERVVSIQSSHVDTGKVLVILQRCRCCCCCCCLWCGDCDPEVPRQSSVYLAPIWWHGYTGSQSKYFRDEPQNRLENTAAPYREKPHKA